MDVGGVWVGDIRGTNVGELIVHLVQQGSTITGVARLNDFQSGAALYSVTGTAGADLSLTLHPERHEPGLNYADVSVIGRLDTSGALSGSWKSTGAGTHGFFTIQQPGPRPAETRSERRVFIVHGHDHGSRDAVVAVLQRLGLTPIVLDEQPSGGRTIIEKLEHYSAVEFAVVLLTGDDEGRARSDDHPHRPRARQNVILELGYFVGRLGRSGVCALYESGVEIPSDYHGVVFVPLAEPSSWQLSLALELKQRWPELDLSSVSPAA